MELNTTRPLKQASINGLAVVGFVALVFVGMTLAIYAARYIPTAVSRVASASVYLSSFFGGVSNNQLVVVPGDGNDSPAISLPIGTSTTPAATSTTGTPATHAQAATPTAGSKSNSAYVLGGSGTPTYTGTLTGLSDLSVHINAVGYLDTKGVTESFIAAKTVPAGKQGAVQFTVTNVGTNVTGSWNFDASLPTSPSYTFHSTNQASLAPGEHIDFTLGFDRGRDGADREIDVTVDPDHKIVEKNESNNDDTATVTINR